MAKTNFTHKFTNGSLYVYIGKPILKNLIAAFHGNEDFEFKGEKYKDEAFKYITSIAKEFKVYVAVFNCDEFVNRYRKYIFKREDSWYGDFVYTLNAPQEIYDEIADLKDESIEII